jgi:Holliday junction resolvase-like predicted endonuclease
MSDFKILKESGETEDYDRRKIRASLLSSGIKADDAEKIIDMVTRTLTPPFTTRKVFRAVKKYMRRYNAVSTMKYSIKQAIYALGPSGYPFEKYIARVLEHQGYGTEVGKLVERHCVTHEVDVVARKDNLCYVIECKFHQNRRSISDVKTALYIHSRFLDIVKANNICPSKNPVHKGMLVTNTRFTSEAIKYAECVGLKTMGWKYPAGQSLETAIEDGRTYPVTILPAATKAIVHALMENDIVLASDLCDANVKRVARLTGLKPDVVSRLTVQAQQICG